MKPIQQHDKILAITKAGIKVYPKLVMGKSGKTWDHKYFVEVSDPHGIVYKNPITTSDVPHTSKTINTAIESTVKHIYEKLCKL